MNMQIDFYHVDSMETVDYEPIHLLIPNSRLIAPSFPEWFDEERAEAYFSERKLIHNKIPSKNPDAVVTTQYYRTISRKEYSNSIAIRLMYGLGEKGALHNREWCEGFDLVLCPGEFSRKLISNWGVKATTIGFPKYDAFFRQEFKPLHQKQKLGLSKNMMSLLYIPTWSVHCSIPCFAEAIKKLCYTGDYQVLFKPHTVTVRREREFIECFRSEIDSGSMVLIEKQIGLAELFPAVDVVLADDMSGAFWEAVAIANLPTVALRPNSGLKRTVLESKVSDVATICDDPKQLLLKIESSVKLFGLMAEKREAIANEIIANRDGTASVKAAQAINEIIEDFKYSRRSKNMRLNPQHHSSPIQDISWASVCAHLKHIVCSALNRMLSKYSQIRRDFLSLGFWTLLSESQDLISTFQSAKVWIDNNSIRNQGICVYSEEKNSYPEVTGYYIPTLLTWGDRQRANDYASWLLAIQNVDGSWSDPSGKTSYTFDTGQILKGLLAILPMRPEAESAIRRGCDWLLTQIGSTGRMVTPDNSAWGLPNGKIVSENIHLYALEPLRIAGRQFDEPRYLEAVERVLSFYLALPDLTEFNTLSHFHAYVLEALVDLGYPDRTATAMKYIEKLQRSDGSIPAYADVSWVCSTGLAQYAVIWYKLGMSEPAQKAFNCLCRLQNSSGGFYGSYGRGANYFPDKEISWAVKYFLDALNWKIRTDFDKSERLFPTQISVDDGRYRLICDSVRTSGAGTVLDAGCGKGRFLRNLAIDFPAIRLHGLDVSEKMLLNLPEKVAKILGGLLDIPSADESFDLVFTVEALEHAVDIPRAISELSRVIVPGGMLVIIDKNRECLGRMKIAEWEQWFDEESLTNILRQNGFTVRVEHNLPYDGRDGSDRLFLAWVATKK